MEKTQHQSRILVESNMLLFFTSSTTTTLSFHTRGGVPPPTSYADVATYGKRTRGNCRLILNRQYSTNLLPCVAENAGSFLGLPEHLPGVRACLPERYQPVLAGPSLVPMFFSSSPCFSLPRPLGRPRSTMPSESSRTPSSERAPVTETEWESHYRTLTQESPPGRDGGQWASHI